MHFWAEKRSPIELSGSVAVSTANAFRFVLVSAEQLIDDACDQALLLGGADRVLRCLHFLGLLGPAAERLDRHSAGTAYACRFRFGLCGPTAERGGWVRRLRCAGRCTRFPSLQTFSLLAVWDAGSWTGSSRPFDDRRGGSAACNRRRALSALGADSARFVIKVERPRIGIRRRSISSFNSSCSAIAVCFICCVRTGGRRNPSSLRAWRQRMRCA